MINLRSYVLSVFQVMSLTMRCVQGSIAKILMEWDPGPVQRLWDPGEPTYSSRSSVPTYLDKLGKPKSYLDYIHLPGLSSLPILVAVIGYIIRDFSCDFGWVFLPIICTKEFAQEFLMFIISLMDRQNGQCTDGCNGRHNA